MKATLSGGATTKPVAMRLKPQRASEIERNRQPRREAAIERQGQKATPAAMSALPRTTRRDRDISTPISAGVLSTEAIPSAKGQARRQDQEVSRTPSGIQKRDHPCSRGEKMLDDDNQNGALRLQSGGVAGSAMRNGLAP
jgi:hypothetical protein